jgi:actin-related protein 8
VVPVAPTTEASTTYDWSNVTFDIVEEASKSPLDGAIAAAIAMAGTENKVKAASMSILLIGGTSALKGIGAFVSER